ncbi:MAG: hypothetical protein ACUZ8O_11630 [Candidatus Anammoxibacter sp.]
MWAGIYYCVFVFLFMVDDVFASQKALKAAREHFTQETNTKWFVIVGIIAVIGIIAWLINGAIKDSKKKK